MFKWESSLERLGIHSNELFLMLTQSRICIGTVYIDNNTGKFECYVNPKYVGTKDTLEEAKRFVESHY
jgi:hypothetical protein